jgi:hypothetical protein
MTEDVDDTDPDEPTSCLALAAPTPGDAAFAARATARLAPNLHRIVNPLDPVPLSWSAADLERIHRLYGASDVPRCPGRGG